MLNSPRRNAVALVASFAVAVLFLFAGPAATARAIALTNNLETVVSLNTNPVTGSNSFTTLAPITLTCGVVDVTAGAADGVAGVTLRLSAGWTFQGGSAPTISYTAWPSPNGQATGTIASANAITDNITTSCSPGSVITFVGVQVQPLTAASGNATVIADINTADVTVARITAQAATPTPTPTPTVAPTAIPTAVPTVAPTAIPTAVPTVVPTAAPIIAPTVPTPAPLGAPAPVLVAPRPAATGNGGLVSGSRTGITDWSLGLVIVCTSMLVAMARFSTRPRA